MTPKIIFITFLIIVISLGTSVNAQQNTGDKYISAIKPMFTKITKPCSAKVVVRLNIHF